jgi:drug/metabolite transporter (DMT)-like permease
LHRIILKKYALKLIDLTKPFWQWAVLIFVAALWGSSFILMKRGLESFSHVQVGAFRMLFAGIILLPLILRKLHRLKKKDLKSLLIVAFIGNFFPSILFALAQTKVDSSLAGMLNSLFPITALIIGAWFYGAHATRKSIIGVIVGLLGSFGLILGSSVNIFSGEIWYSAYILLATIFYAVSLNEIKFKLPDLNGFTVTAFTFLFAAPAAGITLLFTDLQTSFSQPEASWSLFYIFLLGLLSSALALLLFYTLVTYVSPVFAAAITYIIPIFAIMWGLIDGEELGIIQIISMGVVFFGVYLVNRRKTRKNYRKL